MIGRTLHDLGAAVLKGILQFSTFTGRFAAQVFVGFLGSLLRDVPDPIVIDIDSHSVHHARAETAWIAKVNTVTLGSFGSSFPCGPALNPVGVGLEEHLCGFFRSMATVKSQTAKALARLRVMAPELADHYRQVAQSTRPVDLRDQALATARRQGARKLLVTVTVLLACLLGVGALLLGRTQRTPDPAETPSPSPRTTALPAAASLSGPARADEPELTGFLNVTIDVPAWRGVAGRKCPAGRVKLDDHAQHQVANGGPGLTVENSEDGDVDRDGRMDRVAVLRCGPTGGGGYQVVAYRTDTGGDASGVLGRVLSDDAGVGWAGPPAVKDDGLVELEVADRLPGEQPGYAQHQIRAYRWQGGRFTPWPKTHRFPASPAAATLDVKADPLRMEPVSGGYLGSLRITVTNTGAADLPNGQLTIHLPEALHPSGGEWTGCTAVSEHPETGGGTITIVCPLAVPAGTTHETTWTVIATDRAGSDTGSYAAIGQHPPYTLQRGPDHTRTAIVVRWP